MNFFWATGGGGNPFFSGLLREGGHDFFCATGGGGDQFFLYIQLKIWTLPLKKT